MKPDRYGLTRYVSNVYITGNVVISPNNARLIVGQYVLPLRAFPYIYELYHPLDDYTTRRHHPWYEISILCMWRVLCPKLHSRGVILHSICWAVRPSVYRSTESPWYTIISGLYHPWYSISVFRYRSVTLDAKANLTPDRYGLSCYVSHACLHHRWYHNITQPIQGQSLVIIS